MTPEDYEFGKVHRGGEAIGVRGMAMKCPSCGTENPEGKKFCGDCGRKLDKNGPRMCVGCGRPISFDAMICQYCGHDYRPQLQPAQMPRQTTTRPPEAAESERRFSLRSLLLASAILAISALVFFLLVAEYMWSQTGDIIDSSVYLIVYGVIGFYLLIVGVYLLPTK